MLHHVLLKLQLGKEVKHAIEITEKLVESLERRYESKQKELEVQKRMKELRLRPITDQDKAEPTSAYFPNGDVDEGPAPKGLVNKNSGEQG